MKKILFILLFISYFCPLCFASKETAMDKAMKSWIGYSIDDVIAKWGMPNEEKTIADKRTFYWYRSRQVYVPQTSYTNGYVNTQSNNYYNNTYGQGNYNYTTTTSGGYMNTYFCNRTLVVDDDKKVNRWEWRGNRCPTNYKNVKAWVNPQNDIFAQEQAQKAAEKAEKKAKKAAEKAEKQAKKAEKQTQNTD